MNIRDGIYYQSMIYPPPSIVPGKEGGPEQASGKQRNSNLELYRIIVMLLIVAHHYVVNSGLIGVIHESEFSPSSAVMLLFGAWGKTGINCFILITGYFMCRSRITGRKLIKLYLQITLYSVVIYALFCITGHETLSIFNFSAIFWPVKNIQQGFVSCFLVFYLLIPFINILLENLGERRHRILLIILLTAYTVLPLSPRIGIDFNYVTWFCVLYILAAYIRNYGLGHGISHRGWGALTAVSVIMSSLTVTGFFFLRKEGIVMFEPYFLLQDSNKLLAVAVAVSSFMWFKDMRIPHSRLINAVGGATFGVLLIHANSDAMRQWLWRETVDCTGHFGPSLLWTLSYAAVAVLVIFIICAGIDWFRGRFIEPGLMDAAERIFRKTKIEKWIRLGRF